MKVLRNNTPISNRKWHLALLILFISTIILVAPPLISVWVFHAKQPLIIIDATQYVSLITLVASGYFISNVWYKNVEMRNSFDSSGIMPNVNSHANEEVTEEVESEEEKQI